MKNLYLSQPNKPPEVSEGTYYSFNLENGKAIPELEKNKSNEQSMSNLITSIEAATEGDNKVCAVITGHANKWETRGTAYQSNYELGEVRAQNIKYEAQRKSYSREKKDKKWRNVEWVCLSKSNESLSESKAVVKVNLLPTPMDPASLSVSHTKADHQNPLSLMDYVYFANYTITTTGYGDIVPNTIYAKFICTFANICEVFFLVVFFNALLSLKENKQEQILSTKLNEISES
jgi:hypothetical protein